MKIPLVIYKAEVSCGCISAEIPNHPINHGDRGTIKITVDAKKILGKFNKTVFIKSNSQNEKVVLLRVEGIIK